MMKKQGAQILFLVKRYTCLVDEFSIPFIQEQTKLEDP